MRTCDPRRLRGALQSDDHAFQVVQNAPRRAGRDGTGETEFECMEQLQDVCVGGMHAGVGRRKKLLLPNVTVAAAG